MKLTSQMPSSTFCKGKPAAVGDNGRFVVKRIMRSQAGHFYAGRETLGLRLRKVTV